MQGTIRSPKTEGREEKVKRGQIVTYSKEAHNQKNIPEKRPGEKRKEKRTNGDRRQPIAKKEKGGTRNLLRTEMIREGGGSRKRNILGKKRKGNSISVMLNLGQPFDWRKNRQEQSEGDQLGRRDTEKASFNGAKVKTSFQR